MLSHACHIPALNPYMFGEAYVTLQPHLGLIRMPLQGPYAEPSSWGLKLMVRSSAIMLAGGSIAGEDMCHMSRLATASGSLPAYARSE